MPRVRTSERAYSSVDEYQRLKATAPTALAVEELDGATLKALVASRMDLATTISLR